MGLVIQLVLSFELKKKSETFVLCVVHKQFVKLCTTGISKGDSSEVYMWSLLNAAVPNLFDSRSTF